MSLSNRRSFLALMAAPMALSACGFKPIYGDGTAASAMHGRITLGTFSGLTGFQIREELATSLGPATNPTHQLNVDFSVNRKGLAVTPDGSITRYNLTGGAKFAVVDLIGGAGVVTTGNVSAFTAYNATANAYATRVAEQDADRRLARNLADKIITQMAISAEAWLR